MLNFSVPLCLGNCIFISFVHKPIELYVHSFSLISALCIFFIMLLRKNVEIICFTCASSLPFIFHLFCVMCHIIQKCLTLFTSFYLPYSMLCFPLITACSNKGEIVKITDNTNILNNKQVISCPSRLICDACQYILPIHEFSLECAVHCAES